MQNQIIDNTEDINIIVQKLIRAVASLNVEYVICNEPIKWYPGATGVFYAGEPVQIIVRNDSQTPCVISHEIVHYLRYLLYGHEKYELNPMREEAITYEAALKFCQYHSVDELPLIALCRKAYQSEYKMTVADILEAEQYAKKLVHLVQLEYVSDMVRPSNNQR